MRSKEVPVAYHTLCENYALMQTFTGRYRVKIKGLKGVRCIVHRGKVALMCLTGDYFIFRTYTRPLPSIEGVQSPSPPSS